MNPVILKVLFVYGVLSASLVSSQFVPQWIEFLPDNISKPEVGDGFRFTSSQRTVSPFVRISKQVCLQGAWALYSKPNFGEKDTGNADLVVNVVRSDRPNDCSSNEYVQNVLKNTYSARALGLGGVELYPFKNFLSNSEGDILTKASDPIEPLTLSRTAYRSFVAADMEFDYIICGQSGRCICVTEENRPLIVRDVTAFPKNGASLKRLISFNRVSSPQDVRLCESYAKPKE